MTRGAFCAKRTWCFQNFCSCQPKGPIPRRPHHRLYQRSSPRGTPRTPRPTRPSDSRPAVQASCTAPGGPSMLWARSACSVCAMSVLGPFLPRAGPQEELEGSGERAQRSHTPQLPPLGPSSVHSPNPCCQATEGRWGWPPQYRQAQHRGAALECEPPHPGAEPQQGAGRGAGPSAGSWYE